MGDHIGVEGFLFRTKTGEPSLHVEHFKLLGKSLTPLPEKVARACRTRSCATASATWT